MKKNDYIILILLVALALTGCGTENENVEAISKQGISQEGVQLDAIPTEAAEPMETDDAAFVIEENEMESMKMKLIVGENTLIVTMAENSSAKALMDMLKEGPITIEMRDYANMEKVGALGTNLPTNDEQITTEPGDIILYQGNALVIYYAPNSWNFTKLGKIDEVTQEELIEILGKEDVQVTLSLS